jgi:hypothetical protein
MTLIELVKEVVTSWQVIAVTLAIVIYFSIVSSASKSYRRPSQAKKVDLFKKKKPKTEEVVPTSEESGSDSDSESGHIDELGIEEA